MSVLRAVKRNFSGVSWKHPVVRKVMPIVDVADSMVRRRRGHSDLPPYSVRIRSNGMPREFGGARYVETGALIVANLVRYAGLSPSCKVLEIGSGAGRVAYGLIPVLDYGNYTGIDIDELSVRTCQESLAFRRAGFSFVHIDLQSDMYNEGGSGDASEYRLPIPDESFEIVFLQSVFTHLIETECAHYAKEILRVLQPGGLGVVSGLLHELGTGNSAFTLSHRVGNIWVEYLDNPRKVVSSETRVFDGWFERDHTIRLVGQWRNDGGGQFPNAQDWLVYTK